MYVRTGHLTYVINSTWHCDFKCKCNERCIVWVEYLYPVALFLCACTGIILIVLMWWLYKDRWYGLVDWFRGHMDKLFYKLIDMVLGEHEEY